MGEGADGLPERLCSVFCLARFEQRRHPVGRGSGSILRGKGLGSNMQK